MPSDEQNRDAMEGTSTHGHAHGPGSDHGHAHGPAHGHAHGSASGRGFVEQLAGDVLERPLLERGAGQGKLLFLDCPSGIAGDMTIAALLDLGLPVAIVEEVRAGLGLEGVELVMRRGHVGAIGACHFDVRVGGQQPARNYGTIVELLQASSLRPSVVALALRIFERLARAEAEVHRQPLQTVEFHEVGSVDAIIDIVGAAALFDYLGAEVVASPLPLGRGFVDCQHGRLPLPAPATLLCLAGVPTRPSGLEVELVTPTGAAIVATVATAFSEWPSLVPGRVGWGAGTRALVDRPNALRAVLGDKLPNAVVNSSVVLLEANIDDMTGEAAAFALTRLLGEGALDAWLVPVVMKKGRPGLVVSALGKPETAGQLARVLMTETTTLGVRQTSLVRYELPRRTVRLATAWGEVRVKVSGADGTRRKPEFEDVARIARETNRPLLAVLQELQALVDAMVVEEFGP